MRRAYTDVGWLTQENSVEPFGFSLGFDFCAEHEQSVPFLKKALGLPQKTIPIGVEDRTMTRVPDCLELVEYETRPRDRRFKTTLPAALLMCSDHFRYGGAPQDLAERIRRLDVPFYVDVKDKHYRPDRDDIAVAWSSHDGFAIHVRGAENVARLKALHAAMLALTVSLADAAILGFKRKALSLVMNERFPDEVKAEVRANDEAYLRLQQAVDASGIHAALKAAGRGWYALSPTWRTEEGSDLLFFLNPQEQKQYAHGWFTLAELQQWARNEGPVAHSNAIEAALKAEDRDWGYHLHKGLHAAGIHLRVFESFVWLDAKQTQAGVRLLVSRAPEGTLTDGIYPVSVLQPYVQHGRELHLTETPQAA